MVGEPSRSLRSEDVLGLLDVAYQAHASPQAWLKNVAQAALPIVGFGFGLQAYLYDGPSPERFVMHAPVGVGLRPEWEGVWRKNWWDVFMKPIEPQTLYALHGYGVCTYATDVWDTATSRIPDYATYLDRLARTGYGRTHARYIRGVGKPQGQTLFYPDSFNLICADGTGRGVVLLANLPSAIRPFSPEQLHLLGRIANHLAAGLRLQRDKAQAGPGEHLGAAELILGVGGRVAHATGAAKNTEMRGVLRQTMLEVLRSRKGRLPADSVLEYWRALHHGRWSVLDQFDTDGKRFVVARPNTPDIAGIRSLALSEREGQVARLAEAGHSNKTIAYELGLSESTVATHVRRIMVKIGARSRVGLVTLLKARSSSRP
jgi:DNA-binding CsgD family transcriptional regulator